MKVWKIFRHENGKYAYGVYGTKEEACKYLPKVIYDFFLENHYIAKDAFKEVTRKKVKEAGEYRNDKYGLHWEVIETDYCLNGEEFKLADLDENWHDISELGQLFDSESYDIKLIDGSSFNNTVFNEEDGTFVLFDDIISIDEVESFKKHY